MTTHFRFGSNCECLLLFGPFVLSFSIFLLLRFPFCITAGTGVLECNPLAHATRGLGVSASCSTADNCCSGNTSCCGAATTATCSCTTGTAAAVDDAVEHATTDFLPCALLFPLRVLRSCCACYPSRCAHYASPRCASLLTPFVLLSANAVPAADPVLPNAAFVARGAVPVTSCLTAIVFHNVPRWVADLGLPSARQSSSGASAASALRPTASAAEVRTPVCCGGQPRKDPVQQGHLQPAPKSKPRRSRTRSSRSSSKCSNSSSSNSRQQSSRQHCNCSSSSSGSRWPSNSRWPNSNYKDQNNNNNNKYALCLPLRALPTLLRALHLPYHARFDRLRALRPHRLPRFHVGGQLGAAPVPGIPQRAVDDQRARGRCRGVQACGRLA